MKKKSCITLDERRVIQINMLKEFDSFCRANDICYSLSAGTLIGAIRHKGFIPWDDDVDIMMTLPYLKKMKSIFHSDTMKYCDIDTEPHYDNSFGRLIYTPTYRKVGLRARTYGVNIDVYPIVGFTDDDSAYEEFLKSDKPLLLRRRKIILFKYFLLKFLPFSIIPRIPFHDRIIQKYVRHRLYSFDFNKGKKNFIVWGPGIDDSLYPREYFNKYIDVDFEDCKFMSIKDYDIFLRQYYGDYMQLPPEEERVPYHGGDYYWY